MPVEKSVSKLVMEQWEDDLENNIVKGRLLESDSLGWIIKTPLRLKSQNDVHELRFTALVAITLLIGFSYTFVAGPLAVFPAFGLTVVIGGLYLTRLRLRHHTVHHSFSTMLLSSSMAFCSLIFFMATGVVVSVSGRQLNDDLLVAADTALLGWAFPKGQLGLYLDDNRFIGPTTAMGKMLIEVLQIFYCTYFAWGVITLLLILYNFVKAIYPHRKCRRCHELEREVHFWGARLKSFMCGWVISYLLVFSINALIPAVSPRLYLQEYYKHPLDGFGLAGWIRSGLSEAAKGSFGSFPSGHVASSWVPGILTLHLFPKFGRVVTFSALMITVATMYLRYHYFVDVLCAIPIVIVSISFAGIIPGCPQPFGSERDLALADEADDNMCCADPRRKTWYA